MGPTPGQPAAEYGRDAPEGEEPAAAAFPDLDSYVDLVAELEEILRSASAEPEPFEAVPADVERVPDPGESEPETEPPAEFSAADPVAATAAPRQAPRLRSRARPAVPAEPLPPAPVHVLDDADDDPPPLGTGFWQVEDASWAAAPAWREARRTRKADLLIIGALVVLIAGGGAYSAMRFGDNEAAGAGEILPEASRAEAGFGVPFAPVGRAALLRNDPTAPVPSLDAAVAGAEVTPLPVIVEPPVEVTQQPVFLADAATTPPAAETPPAADTPAAPALALGGPLVPFETATAETGVAVGIVTTVTTWVNMRSGPDNAEAVVMVVSPDTPVAVRACDYWCRVTVNGRDGYIFKDFLVALP